MKLAIRVLLALALFAAGHAAAQSYPTKPIRFVVPFAPGGSTDTLARTLGQKLSDGLGQQVVIDNRTGANGNIGMDIVAKAPPDGHTIVLGYIANVAIGPSLYDKLPFDPVKDYEHVTLIATSPNVLVAHPSLKATNMKELIALAKTQPGKLSYASAGVASVGHLTGEYINQLAGVRMTHIAYKGSGQAVTDLLGGHIQLMYSGFSSTLPHIKSGKLRALAQTGEKRSPALADVPTIAEQGFPKFEATAWYGVHAPAKTPKPIVNRLNAEIVKALKLPDVRERLSSLGFEIAGSTPEAYSSYIKTEIVKWAKVVKASGAKAE
ncbi:MAG TPA: tripartite tricarboxylate transporter substrate binding protein [Burkholderiales bacterium]|nr:tripartite tricarboxylate transporter substrate binding protein [Burkholderiales bacterium]